MAITVLSGYGAVGKDAGSFPLHPHAGSARTIGPYTITALAGAGEAGDYYVIDRFPMPFKVYSATWTSSVDPGEAMTVDVGWGLYDSAAASVTVGDIDYIVDGFDVDAAQTTATAMTIANANPYYRHKDYPDLILKIATGTTLTATGTISLVVGP